VAKSQGQKNARSAARTRKRERAVSEREKRAANQANGSSGLESLSARDVDTLWERFEKGQREAYMRAVEVLSLDPRENQRVVELRKAEQEAARRALEEVSLGLKAELLPAPAPLAYPPPPPAPG